MGRPARWCSSRPDGNAVLLGVSRQLIGEDAFGTTGYRYCGNILAAAGDAQFAGDEALVEAAAVLVRTVTEEFGVVGVNGIDFVAARRRSTRSK